jgi:hypothetical protein
VDLTFLLRECGDGDGSRVESVPHGAVASVAGVDANGDGYVDFIDAGAMVTRIFRE